LLIVDRISLAIDLGSKTASGCARQAAAITQTHTKGGITDNGEESQGREEEGRQETLTLTSPVKKKRGRPSPPFDFLPDRFYLRFSPSHVITRRITSQGCS
jgi:hypothetical protein